MIYWFKRKKDNEYVPLEDEKAASLMIFSRKDFKEKFEYIGRTDGSKFNEVIKAKGKMPREKYLAVLETGEQNESYNQAARDAFAAELAVALEMKDRALPRDFRVMDIDGNPADPTIAGVVKMVIR